MITSDQHPSVQLGNSCAQNFSRKFRISDALSTSRSLASISTFQKERERRENEKKKENKREVTRKKIRGEREREVNSRKFSHCLRTWKSFVAISWKMTIDSSSYLAVELHLQRAFNVNNCPLYIRITKTQGTG